MATARAPNFWVRKVNLVVVGGSRNFAQEVTVPVKDSLYLSVRASYDGGWV